MEFLTLLLLQLLACLSIGLYLYSFRKWRYWSSRGIPGSPPGFLHLGNTLDRLLKSPADFELQQMRQYGLVYGRYRGLQPTLTVNDPTLIKQIMVKDFALFMNKQAMNTYDKYWNLALFNAESDRWKRIRTITSPTFSSGKLRAMRRLMGGCVEKLADYFDTVIAEQNGRLNVKQVLAGFTVDVIASSAFATETNANSERSQVNPVVSNGIKLFQMNSLKVLSFLVLPRSVNALLGVRHPFVDQYFYFFSDLSREIRLTDSGSQRHQRRVSEPKRFK